MLEIWKFKTSRCISAHKTAWDGPPAFSSCVGLTISAWSLCPSSHNHGIEKWVPPISSCLSNSNTAIFRFRDYGRKSRMWWFHYLISLRCAAQHFQLLANPAGNPRSLCHYIVLLEAEVAGNSVSERMSGRWFAMFAHTPATLAKIASFRRRTVSRIERHEKTKNDEEGNVYAPASLQSLASAFTYWV